MELKVNTSIPITFEKVVDTAIDKRFTNVKVWICHTKDNLNGSYFEKSVLESMIPSLANIMIVGYIALDNLNEADFKGHEQRLILDENGVSIEYLGRAYGLIPETNNATFEKKICEDGVEREFLVCEGKLWNKFEDCIDIFDRDTAKSESMELLPDSIKGAFGKDKLFHFAEGTIFEAACVLGKGIVPAMTGAVIEKFSYSDLKKEISEMIQEYAMFANEQNSLQPTDSEVAEVTTEGGTNLDKILEMLQKYSLTIEDLVANNINHADFSLEELEAKVQSFQTENPITEPEAIVEPTVQTNFALTSEQMEDELERELAEIETITKDSWGEIYTYPRYCYKDSKPESNVVVAFDCKNRYLVGFNYSVTGDSVEVDEESIVRYKIELVPMDLSSDTAEGNGDSIAEIEDEMFSTLIPKAESEFELNAREKFLTKQFESDKEVALVAISTDFAVLQEENSKMSVRLAEIDAELKAKVQAERDEAVQAIFASFPTLTDEEKADLLSKNANFSLEEIDYNLCAILGRKNRVEAVSKFAAKEPEKPYRIQLPTATELEKKTTGNAAVDAIFQKHLSQ